MALQPPELRVPASKHTVDVSIIDTTASPKGMPAHLVIGPAIAGHTDLAAPCWSFLIQHPTQKRSLVFDLGIRKDYWNLSPALQAHLKDNGAEIVAEKDVREILDEHGVDTKAIEAVIWSHWHFDHTGNPATFEPTTALIVGPGFKEDKLPGYPADPNGVILEADYAGRELRELAPEDFPHKVGRFRAHDYFGDGSFYLLDAPGHAVGHLCGFARVTSNPDSFIYMGGDSYHHAGEIRPSPYMPLPDAIVPHPFLSPARSALLSGPACPGAIFEHLSTLPDGGKTRPFYEPARGAGGAHHDVDEAVRTIEKLQEADVAGNVLVAAAHDESLLGVVDFFPHKANDFMAKDWVSKCRWRFLRDFAVAVGRADEVEDKIDWAPSKVRSQG